MATTFAPTTPGVGGAPTTPPSPKKTSHAVSITVFAIMAALIVSLVVALVTRSSDSPAAVAPANTVAQNQAPVTTTQIGTSVSTVATTMPDLSAAPVPEVTVPQVELSDASIAAYQALISDPQGFMTDWLNRFALAQSSGNPQSMDLFIVSGDGLVESKGEFQTISSIEFTSVAASLLSDSNYVATLSVTATLHRTDQDGSIIDKTITGQMQMVPHSDTVMLQSETTQ